MNHLVLILCLMFAGPDQPWPQWRGPQGDGVNKHFRAPAVWPDQPAKLWSFEIGKGYGSPIVAADHIFIMSNIKGLEHIRAVSLKTGKLAWQMAYPIRFTPNPAAPHFGDGPFATPLYHDGKLYVVGTTGQIHCLDATNGKVVWKKNYNGDLTDTRKYFCGNSVSPIVYGDTVIFHIGNESEGIMTAFDAKTGAEKWQWRGDVPGYATPVIAYIGGADQMVTLTQNFLNGLDPKTGKHLWKVPFTSTWRENAISPMVLGHTVVISGVERKTVAFELNHSSGKWHVKQQWENSADVLYMSNPVLQDGVMYGMSYKNKGQFFAMDMSSGKTLWQGPARVGKNSSIQLLGNLVAAVTTDAQLKLFKARRDKYELVKNYDFGLKAVWAQPVFFDGKLLVKDDEHLHLFTFQTGKKGS